MSFDAKEMVNQGVDAIRHMETDMATALMFACSLQVSVDDSLAAICALEDQEHRQIVKVGLHALHDKLEALLVRLT